MWSQTDQKKLFMYMTSAFFLKGFRWCSMTTHVSLTLLWSHVMKIRCRSILGASKCCCEDNANDHVGFDVEVVCRCVKHNDDDVTGGDLNMALCVFSTRSFRMLKWRVSRNSSIKGPQGVRRVLANPSDRIFGQEHAHGCW